MKLKMTSSLFMLSLAMVLGLTKSGMAFGSDNILSADRSGTRSHAGHPAESDPFRLINTSMDESFSFNMATASSATYITGSIITPTQPPYPIKAFTSEKLEPKADEEAAVDVRVCNED